MAGPNGSAAVSLRAIQGGVLGGSRDRESGGVKSVSGCWPLARLPYQEVLAMSHEQLELNYTAGDEPRFSVDYLTIAEAAATVRCNERTIRRAIASGELRAGRVRGGGSSRGGYRIRPRDLDDWLFGHAS
jgi:excisionase family DNA binding protein